MKYWYDIRVMQQLANSEIARNNPKKGYIEFLQTHYCKNEVEKAIIERVLNETLSWASYKREVAYIQNTMWLYEPNEDVKAKRAKHRKEIQKWYSPITRIFKIN